MQRTLTDAMLRSLSAPRLGRLELTDLRCAGLTFRLTDKRVGTFSFRFRSPQSGRIGRLTLGKYPDLSLARARARADELRRDVASGKNPSDERRRERDTAASRSFGTVAGRYIAEYAQRHKAASSAAQDERNLKLHVLPHWRNRNIATIRRSDIIELVERIVAANKPVQANRVQALISGVFSFAVEVELVEANPCFKLRKRGGKETPKTRILSDDEIRQLWPRAVLPPLTRRTGLALRLILLTFCRRQSASETSRSLKR